MDASVEEVREAKLLQEDVLDALADLDCGLAQSLSTDDPIIIGHMRAAAATLRSVARRLNAFRNDESRRRVYGMA